MRIAITGANGQVGQALMQALASEHTLLPITHADVSLENRDAVSKLVALEPEYMIHSAAWTNVDGCARDPDQALRVNALGTKHVALACRHLDIPLLYLGTNEVFDGTASQPYLEFDRPNPINPYGYSKWAGEQIVQQTTVHYAIVRVAWVFGGARNFVRTVLRLARERSELTMVDDEIGNPTYAPHLADALGRLLTFQAQGIFHLTNQGACSRYDFAQAILDQGDMTGVTLKPIPLTAFKRDSTPPRYGALRNFVAATEFDIQLPPWQDALAHYISLIDDQPIPSEH